MITTPSLVVSSAVARWIDGGTALATLLPTAGNQVVEQLARMDRLCGLALVGSETCLAALGTSWREYAAHTAVLCGSRNGCLATDAAFYRGVLAGEASPRLFAYTLHSAPAGAVSIQHGLWGPGSTAVGSTIAGLQALEEACLLLSAGQVHACLVLSCDTEWTADHDVVAALYLTQSSALRASVSPWRVVAVRSSFCPGHAQQALSQVMEYLRQQVPQVADAYVLGAEGPPLALMAELLHGTVPAGAQQPEPPTDTVVMAATDAQGYAAAAVLRRCTGR